MNTRKTLILGFIVFIFIFTISFFVPGYFLPTDLLKNIPSFSTDKWERPKNSLLADPVFQFEPWRHYAKERFLEGSFPILNDHSSGGVPFFANPQTSVLFPVNIFYYLLPLHQGLFLIHAYKIYLLFIFTFLYLRSLKCSYSSSLIGSTTVSFSAFPIVWLLWPHTNVFLFFPFLLFVTEKIFSDIKFKFRWYLLISVSYFFAILGGHPETLFHILILHVVYIIARLWKQKNKIEYSFLSILIGFSLGAFQLVPFFEYLKNSYALRDRLTHPGEFFLPIKAFVLNVIPFILGAPHLEFYKHIDPSTNFQESVGGYVGPIVLTFSFLGIFVLRKNFLVRLWTGIVLVLWAIVYNIWPFSLLSTLPVFGLGANHRFIGFSGFGLCVVFSLTIERLISKKNLYPSTKKIIKFIIFIILLLTFLSLSALLLYSKSSPDVVKNFIQFFIQHILLLSITTILFLYVIYSNFEKMYKVAFIIILILLQTAVLFWDYNPFTDKKDYYPEPSFVSKLKKLEQGSILEVGNPVLPENINLMYGISHAENYDAMEVEGYKKKFDEIFPKKNQWGNPDDITYENVKKLGIKYVISDYDITLAKQKVQAIYKKILPSIISSRPISIEFAPSNSNLRQIRILTANFNRKNNCTFSVSLFDYKTEIKKETVDCLKIRDFMYFTIPFSVTLDTSKKYTFVFDSKNASSTNSIALWADEQNNPFMELLYKQETEKEQFLPIWNEDNIFIWSLPESLNSEFLGNSKIIYQTPEESLFLLQANKDTEFILKETYFPGWEAYIDENKITIHNADPFIKVSVPKGIHTLKFSYKPYSLIVGIFISSITFTAVIILIFRKISKEDYILMLIENIRKKIKKYSWQSHFLVFATAFVLSVLIFISFTYYFPLHFTVSKTSTSINWFTINNYPKQQDMFFFIIGFIFTTIFTVLFWFILLCKRK